MSLIQSLGNNAEIRDWTTIKQLHLNVTGKTLRVGKERQKKAFHSNLFFSEIQKRFLA
jgi:hypothetical protein